MNVDTFNYGGFYTICGVKEAKDTNKYLDITLLASSLKKEGEVVKRLHNYQKKLAEKDKDKSSKKKDDKVLSFKTALIDN